MGIGDEAPLVAAGDVGLDGNVAPAGFATDARCADTHVDLGDFPQRDRAAGRQRDLQFGQIVCCTALIGSKACDDIEIAITFEHRANHRAAERRLNGGIGVAGVEPEPRHGTAIENRAQFGLTTHLDRRHVGCAGNGGDNARRAIGQRFENGQIGAKDLDRNLAFHA